MTPTDDNAPEEEEAENPLEQASADDPEEEATENPLEQASADDPEEEAIENPLERASAEDCYEEAGLLLESGNQSLALQLLQVAIAKDPTNATYREALSSVREMLMEQGHRKEQDIQAREKLNRDLEAAPVTPPPRVEDRRSNHRHIIKAAAAVVLIIVAALNTAWALGAFDKPVPRPEVDATPYMNISLVVERSNEGTVPTDLVLHVAPDWKTMPEKMVLVKKLSAAASTQGFSAVTILDGEGRKVASTRNHGKVIQLY